MSTTLTTVTRERLPALKLVQSSLFAWRLAQFLLVALALSILAMVFAPWQQTSRGTGKVVAYVPQERQQTVTSPAKGVVLQVANGLREGMRVEKDDFILEIEPVAANLIGQLQGQKTDLDAKLATLEAKAEVYDQNIVDFQAAQVAAVSAADELVLAAKSKLDAEKKLIAAYEAKKLQAQQNYDRQSGLAAKGIKSTLTVEKLKKELDVATSELNSLHLKIEALNKEWEAKKNERLQKERIAKTKVDYARAMKQDALGQIATLSKERRSVNIKLAELERLKITAPRAGTIFRLPIYERGQAIKEGDALFTIVPDTTQRVVELWVPGNDMPLIREGDPVRLQFEGWPAIQFAGAPSFSSGTFGGKVAAIDPTDDGKGKFRIQVKPDDPMGWPSDTQLRQGVRANGWVLLRQVPLGWEIWRQLNGFPPAIKSDDESEDKSKDKKKVKLPK